MKEHIGHISEMLEQNGSRMTHVPLYPCLSLAYLSLRGERLSLQHEPLGRIMEINYCRTGRIGWQMASGSTVYLGPGDFCVHTMSACADSVMTFPNGTYEGLTLFVDLDALTAQPPEILSSAGLTGYALEKRLCPDRQSAFFAGNETSERIFSGFFDAPPPLADAYRRLRALELLLFLSTLTPPARSGLSAYRSEQVEAVRRVHDWLLDNLSTRVTIETLSRQFLMNPTTLKALFRAVYGDSIAAHIRAHRMEKAAELLTKTDAGIADIAQSVGYDSQSRFTEAFRDMYRLLPTEYRKRAAAASDTPDAPDVCVHGRSHTHEQ